METLRVKLRQIGTSRGVIIPNEQLKEAAVDIGDEFEIAILPHKKAADIDALFGMARNAGPFVRDKKTREF